VSVFRSGLLPVQGGCSHSFNSYSSRRSASSRTHSARALLSCARVVPLTPSLFSCGRYFRCRTSGGAAAPCCLFKRTVIPVRRYLLLASIFFLLSVINNKGELATPFPLSPFPVP
jgi:hypothetical protein